jgi:hypothetical protein
MRALWEIFTVIMGVLVIFAIAKGFPAFGKVLAFLLFNPIGLISIAGLIIWMIVLRNRAIARKAAGKASR